MGGWRKESRTNEDCQMVFKFGGQSDPELMVGSPLKKRRISPPSPDGHTGPPPISRTRPSPCTPATWSPRTSWRRPPSMHTKPERAPQSTIQRKQPVLCEKGSNIGHASRWPSWRSTADSPWTRPSSSVIESTLDINPISSIQTFDDCRSLPYCVQAMAGSN